MSLCNFMEGSNDMLSLTLLKMNLKKNYMLMIVFSAVLVMYMAVMVWMFNPDDIEQLMSMLDLFPADLMKAMGFSSLITDFTSYLASWLYGLLMFGFPMVYCILLSNRLVARMVDNNSFAYLLSTPNSRSKIILTQGAYAILSLLALFVVLFGTGVFFSALILPGLLDVPAFFQLNVTTFLLNLLVMMICFFASCLFNDSRSALGVGSAIPIAFLLMNMLGGASEQAEILQRLSIYGLYDPVDLVQGKSVWFCNLGYTLAALLLFGGSVLVFRKKQLPL